MKFWLRNVFAISLCLVAAALAGCGGGDNIPGTHGGISPPGVPPDDDYDYRPQFAHQIFPDNGRISGAINFAEDVDMFKFSASANVAYGLQFLGIPVPDPDASDPRKIVVDVLDATGAVSVTTSQDPGLDEALIAFSFFENRIVFTTPVDTPLYIRVRHDRPGGTGNYVFNLASDQLGDAQDYRQHLQSYGTIFDPENNVVLHPAPSDFFGYIKIWDYNLATNFIGVEISTPVVFFLDADGTAKDVPETPELHIHLGIPDNTPGTLHGNLDFTPSASGDHSSLFTFPDITPGGIFVYFIPLPGQILHIMQGLPWYMDLHVTNNFDALATEFLTPVLFDPMPPMVSSRANGTLNMFESRLDMNGANVVPPVSTPNALALYYNTAVQAFMIAYEIGPKPNSNIRLENAPMPDPSLVGKPIHIHSGGPGSNGRSPNVPLIDLGTVPAPVAEPAFESVPELKNVVKILTDQEASILRNATYNGGWYVHVHTDDDRFPNGEIRAEGFIEIQTDPRGLAGGPNTP